MIDKRPINVNPLSIKLPLTAWISITHRISGFLLFLLIPFCLWMLQASLASPETFASLTECLSSFFAKVVLFFLLSGFVFHLVAGFRHLLMDMHLGESLKGGRMTSMVTFMVSIVLILAMAIRLWG